MSILSPCLKLGQVVLHSESYPYLIAEIGHNHQGSLKMAIELVKKAREAGAHAVKFQKRENRKLFIPSFYNKPYSSRNSFGKTYGEHREWCELSLREYEVLRDLCFSLGIDFFATPLILRVPTF